MTTAVPVASRLAAYLALTKPRIVELLLITTVPAMILASEGWPGIALVGGTLAGGALSAGGANAINNVVDRDIDARMSRTRRRPVASARVAPGGALAFGVLLGIAGFGVLWLAATPEAAWLATGALVFYVGAYTLGLKRTTVHNIVIGGAAGAVPALVGWAAVTGGLALPAWVMFGIVFSWTPPHFWALSIRFREDYARAGVPMLPVVSGEEVTRVQILAYSALVVAVSALLAPVAGLGVVYLAMAAVLGGVLIWRAVGLQRGSVRPLAFFNFSNLYLALLFGAVALDVVVGRGGLGGSATGVALGAAVAAVTAEAVVIVTLRPVPRSVADWLWLLLPMAGAIVLAWWSVSSV